MKIYLILLTIFGVIVTGIVLVRCGKESENASEKSVAWFKKESDAFAVTATNLKKTLEGHGRN